jgi:hypothetical protein
MGAGVLGWIAIAEKVADTSGEAVVVVAQIGATMRVLHDS